MPKKRITPDTPLGKNGLATSSMWKERTLYRDMSHEFKPYELADLWYGDGIPPGKLLYGRVNPAGDSVFLAEENLKQMPSESGPTMFALNFVADAFRDLTAFWNGKVVARGFVKENSPFYQIQPQQAWISPHIVFHQKQSDEYDQITNHKQFLSTKRDEKIINLEGFLKVYLEFYDRVLPTVPMTRSQWLSSRYASPLFSGLMIEIQHGVPHGDDYVKHEGFITDEAYDMWIQAAMRYGFVVDKNAPWRIIADLNAPQMEKYLKRYGVNNLKETFESYYVDAFYSDIETLRQYVKNMYKSFIVANPNVKRKVPSPTLEGMSAYKLTRRAILTDAEFEEKYPPVWWIRFYTYVRAREGLKEWDQARFEAVVKNAQKKAKYINMDAALEYINGACGGYRRHTHGYKSLDSNDIQQLRRDRSTQFRGGTFNF